MKFQILFISLTSISLCVCNAFYKFEFGGNRALPYIFNDAIERIGRLSHGKELLRFISDRAVAVELLIVEGSEDAFIGNNERPSLSIKCDSSKCYVGAPVFSDDKLIVDEHYVVPIGKVEIPKYITIAHELIHYAHFLENQHEYNGRLTKDPVLYKDKY